MTEYTLEASVKLGMIEYALVASVDPCGSLLAESIAECHYTGPQPVTISTVSIAPIPPNLSAHLPARRARQMEQI
jgi:hypothetical protein